MLTPHPFMPEIRAVALDARLFDAVEEVLAEQALLSFTMFYFKPPGARGQAFHEDNFYLKVQPGTCCAVWIACDGAGWQRCDSLGDGCADAAGLVDVRAWRG